MYNKPMISLEQAQNAIAAMIADYNRDTNRRKVDMAVVDDAGNLLAYARMDRCLRPTFAIRKAYTSAVRSMDTVAFAEQLSSSGRSLESFGDPAVDSDSGRCRRFTRRSGGRRHRRGWPAQRARRRGHRQGRGSCAGHLTATRPIAGRANSAKRSEEISRDGRGAGRLSD